MASRSTSYSRSNSAAGMSDIVANSSLTATASEFVPNASSTNKTSKGQYQRKKQGEYSNDRAGHNNSGQGYVGSGRTASQQGGRRNYYRQGFKPSHQGGDSESVGEGRNGAMDEGYPSRSSSRSSTYDADRSGSQRSRRNPGNQADFSNRGRKEWTQQGTSETNSDYGNRGACGGGRDASPAGNSGNHHFSSNKPFFFKDNAPGYKRNKDWNGNQSNSRSRDQDQPYDQESRMYDRENSHKQYRSNPHIVEYNTGPERGSDRQRDPQRYRDSNYVQDRDEDGYTVNGASERFSETSAVAHAEWGYDRNSHRYSDRYQERHTDKNRQGRPWNTDDTDYNRDYDKEYGRRGAKQNQDFSRNGQGRKYGTSNSYRSSGASSSHNVNVQETFGSNSIKPYSEKNTDFPDRDGRESSIKNRSTGSSRAFSQKQFYSKDCDDVSQRERLTDQLCRGTLECLVCCDRVRQHDSVWSCANCYHVLHMRCVTKWAKSSEADGGWRCPACQNVTKSIPSQYRCFCGKAVDPQWNRSDTPHTCGEVCGRSRESTRPLCTHRCTLLCHPGPCPPCVAQVTRSCGCGKTSKTVKCGQDKELLCESVCGKLLNCGVHTCEKDCHTESCGPCNRKIEQVCYCLKQKREVDCIVENLGVTEFCCEETCSKNLVCGKHKCKKTCHSGDCAPCHLTPDVVTHCPCGKTKLDQDPEHKRKSCTDPIPTCEKVCGRTLKCGQPSNPHVCKVECHTGDCPPCKRTTLVRCRCGHMDREISCEQLTTKADDARCEKKCTKKRSCAKHKCNQLCCIQVDHTCPLPCNHMLTCGQHRCEQLCHRGHCQPCWRTSFEELFCECGAEVFYPPVPCGTKPPPCSRPCPRQHECNHDALHSCHSEQNCPPCTVLTEKWCYGNHELRKSIPCHQKEFSCGLPCNKQLPCGRHKCIQPCHKGECLRSGPTCTQPCTVPRSTCQHPCTAPCHEGTCPETPCKETVRVTCECGHRSAMRPCSENVQEYQRIATSLLASKMADVQLGHSIDIGDIMGNPSTRKLYLKSLECNDECKIIERNRRMAIGLQIRNPDLSSKLTPRYPDSMRAWAKKDPAFCQMVHDKLTELVKLAKESKQKSRSYSFEVMNRDKRQFIHEYCEHFGCDSVAYDQEPKRNVVATAQKEKAWLPSVSLLELVQREAGQRKVPGPMLNSTKKPMLRNMDSLPNRWSTKPNISSSIGGGGTVSSMVKMGSTSFNSSDGAGSSASGGSSYIDHFNS